MFLCFQEESGLTESRPGTAQTVTHVDPLALDIEDLYVKYKVLKQTVIYTSNTCIRKEIQLKAKFYYESIIFTLRLLMTVLV